MKKSFLKQVIPVLTVLIATAGAFGTHAMTTSLGAQQEQPGYIKLNEPGTSCEDTEVTCTTQFGPLCTVGTTQLWGKDEIDRCVVELYQIQP